MADSFKLQSAWFRSYEDFAETGGTPTTYDTIPRPSSRRRQQQSRAGGAPSLARAIEGVATKGPIPGYGEYARQELDRALNAPPPSWMTPDTRAGDALGQDASHAMVGRVYLLLMDAAQWLDRKLGTGPAPPAVPPLPPANTGYYP